MRPSQVDNVLRSSPTVTNAMGQVSSIPSAVWQFVLVSAGGALVGLIPVNPIADRPAL